MWMGGWAPFGYAVKDRKLVIDETEAETVRRIFDQFAKCGSTTTIARQLTAESIRNRYGHPLDKGRLYFLLHNRVYIGEAVHKGTAYPGEHQPIVSQAVWDRVQAVLAKNPRIRAGISRAQTPALLKGLIFGSNGRAMSPTHTRKGQRLYRYYVDQAVIKGEAADTAVRRLPAGVVEKAAIDQLRVLLSSPEIVVATARAAKAAGSPLPEPEVRDALHRFDELWDELFPAEQARIVRLLVERVQVDKQGIDISLRTGALTSLIADLRAPALREAA
jgi:hypothetical protein